MPLPFHSTMIRIRRKLRDAIKLFRDAVRYGPRTARNLQFIFSDRAKANFYSESIFRAAEFAVTCRFPSGIFDLIGMDYAHRVANAWRPREIELLRELSLAFHEVEQRRGRRMPRWRVEALATAMFSWFDYIGEDRTLQSVREELYRRMGPETAVVEDDAADDLNRTVDPSTIPLLWRLHKLSKEIDRRFPADYDRGIGQVGLLLYDELKNENYWRPAETASITVS